LALGGINPAKHIANIEYVPVISENKSDSYEWWQLYSQGITVIGGNRTTNTNIQLEKGHLAVFDSGAT
jgi:hypothetical protein